MSDDNMDKNPDDIVPAHDDTLVQHVEQVQEQVQAQVQQNVQNNTSNADLGSVLDSVADYMIIDSIVDGFAAIGEGLASIIGSMFD